MALTLESVWQDVCYAARGLARNRTFALTAITACALGVGATTSVFSIVDRVLFKPLPYAHADRLASVGMMTPLDSNEFVFASGYFDLRRMKSPFEQVTAFQAGTIPCDLTETNPLRLACLRIEANYLETFGVPLATGRSFTREEDLPNGPRVAIISYGLWQSRFGGQRNIIGRTLQLDGAATEIVGVLPRDFDLPPLSDSDILQPLALNEAREREGRALRAFGRLAPGRTAESAYAELQPYFQRVLETVPPQFRKEVSLRVRPLRDRQMGEFRTASLTLFGAVMAVLLIACANIANLLLARSLARDRELAMRAALGASRARLAQQALIESLMVGAAGGIAGCLLAYGLVRTFVYLAPEGMAGIDKASIDLRVLAFTLIASIGTGLLSGLGPALRRPTSAMMGQWRTAGGERGWMRHALVSAQIGMSLVLLTGAGLLLHSLWKLEKVQLGMETENVVTARFVLGRQQYAENARQLAFFDELDRRLHSMPGATAAAVTDSLPPTGGARGRPLSSIEVEGKQRIPEGTGGMVTWRYVSPGYFATLGIPILKGRGFTGEDQATGAYSMVVSESLAKRWFHEEQPLGRRVLKGPNGEWFTVVGVAGNVKNAGLAAQPSDEYYVVRKPTFDMTYANQEPPIGWRSAVAMVRTPLSPALAAASLRQLIGSLEPTLPVEIQTLEARVGGAKARPRFYAILLGAFAAIGLALAAVGLFGVMSFLVARRTRELGVRMALGATKADILKTVLRHAVRWTAAGLLLGLAGSIALSRSLTTMLFEVDPLDPLTLSIAAALLCAVAALAAIGPARRASRLEPSVTLREE